MHGKPDVPVVPLHPVDVAAAALCEARRPDLAELIAWFNDDGGYIEVNDLILSEADWALIDRAEAIARHSIGQPPMERPLTNIAPCANRLNLS